MEDDHGSVDHESNQELLATIEHACAPPLVTVSCPACNASFEETGANFARLSTHLIEAHRLYIYHLRAIAIIKEYLQHIQKLIEREGFEVFAKTLPVEDVEGRTVQVYGRDNTSDAQFRETLRLKLLTQLIETQRIENSAVAVRECLHCSFSISGTVKDICEHMFELHGFSVGLPDNLVHLPRLLDILKFKLDHLQCFYCEHIFKSTKVLKEHMRKKKHWRIPQSRPLYDQFYLVTFSQPNNDYAHREEMEEEDNVDEEMEDWQDWDESASDNEADKAQCIYCPSQWKRPQECFDHMQREHEFDFFGTKQKLALTPYQCIAWINHCRKCAKERICAMCSKNFESMEQVLEHQRHEKHLGPPLEYDLFSDPSLMIPTLPGDMLLTGIDGNEAGDDD